MLPVPAARGHCLRSSRGVAGGVQASDTTTGLLCVPDGMGGHGLLSKPGRLTLARQAEQAACCCLQLCSQETLSGTSSRAAGGAQGVLANLCTVLQ